MKILLALVVGFLIALVLFMLSPVVRDLGNRARRRLYLWQLQLLAQTQGATMAVPADILTRPTGMPGSDMATVIAEHNKLVTKFRQLTAKLDADAGVTDVNYGTLITANDAASPALITGY